MSTCDAPAPGGRRSCERDAGHVGRHAWSDRGVIHEWAKSAVTDVAANASPESTSPRLGERGQVYVSLSAAERYAEARRLRVEEARREVTELLLDAKCTREAESHDGVAHYRARSRQTQLDVSATVVREGLLLVVASVNVREYR